MKRDALIDDPLPGDAHGWCRRLLPWYAAGGIDARRAGHIERHLGGCALCREELRAERALLGLLRADSPVELAPQAGLARVLQRIERRERWRDRLLRPLRALGGERAQRPLALAVTIQALVIVLLSAALLTLLPWRGREAAAYRTLSTPATAPAPAAGATVRLVLDEALTVRELQRALEPWRGTIVAGPEGRGIFTVRVDGDAAAVVRELRLREGVLLAEVVASP